MDYINLKTSWPYLHERVHRRRAEEREVEVISKYKYATFSAGVRFLDWPTPRGGYAR
jgi:hypothetical protein